MVITKLELIGFGQFRNQSFHLGPGLNIIYGGNEGGKTTLSHFIYGMFYDFVKPGTKRAFSEEKERYRPLEGPYEGALELIKGGVKYRLERNFQRGRESLRIFLPEEGREITEEMDFYQNGRIPDCGRYFLDGGREIYSRTGFIPQLGVETEDLSRELARFWNGKGEGEARSLVYQKLTERREALGTPGRKSSYLGGLIQDLKEMETRRNRILPGVREYRAKETALYHAVQERDRLREKENDLKSQAAARRKLEKEALRRELEQLEQKNSEKDEFLRQRGEFFQRREELKYLYHQMDQWKERRVVHFFPAVLLFFASFVLFFFLKDTGRWVSLSLGIIFSLFLFYEGLRTQRKLKSLEEKVEALEKKNQEYQRRYSEDLRGSGDEVESDTEKRLLEIRHLLWAYEDLEEEEDTALELAKRQVIALEERLFYLERFPRELRDLEEEEDLLKEKRDQALLEIRALDLALEGVRRGNAAFFLEHRRNLEEETSRILQILTGGRYHSLAWGDRPSVQEISGTRKDLDHLSTGTKDQVYLAYRLALFKLFHKEAPLVMDDTMNHFDEERREGAWILLKELAKERQVLYATSRKDELPPVEWNYKSLELGKIR